MPTRYRVDHEARLVVAVEIFRTVEQALEFLEIEPPLALPETERRGRRRIGPGVEMQLELRRARRGDEVRLSAIARSAKASWGYPETLLASWEPVLRISADYVEREVVFVALEGARVVAFYALERRGDLWQLEHLWIEPGAQKRGLGRRLFAHALEQVGALGPGRVRIEADPHAAAFYARMGAREVGRIAAPLEGDPGRYLPVFEMSIGGP